MPGGKIHSHKRNGKPALFWTVLMTVVGTFSPTPAQEAKPFYEGKTIQFFVASGPGATTDISARLVSRYLGKHIPGNPAIIVQNMPGGGGLVGANYFI
jgi:tripartite-type tricarboxylate transporter receptor subunit TctC